MISMCPSSHDKKMHSYAWYKVDEDGKVDPEDPGFSPGLPDWLSQPAFDALVKRDYVAITKDHADYLASDKSRIGQGKGNYEIKKRPNSTLANSKPSLVQRLFKRFR